MECKVSELVKLGHDQVAELKSSCCTVDVRAVAQLISDLATQLDVQLARSNSLAAENAGLKSFGDKLDEMHNDLNGEGTGIQGRAEVACQQVALEAEAVSVFKINHESSLIKHVKKVVSETHTPAAPVSVPEMKPVDLDEGFEEWYSEGESGADSVAPEWFSEAMKPVFLGTWRACRAAMLQGAEPVKTANKLPFEQWLLQQTGTIDVECGCVMTEVFFHWLRVAYEAGNSPAIPDAYDIEAFGIFSATEGENGLMLQIERFRFGTEKCPQIGKENMVPKFALQGVINRLQEHCDSLGNEALVDILSKPTAPDFREIWYSSTNNFRENAETSTKCWCRTCRPITLTDMRFVVCPDCGNKRCPHANDHRHACTGSNEPGQEGSAYPAAPQQEVK